MEQYKVLYKITQNGNYQLSKDMDFEKACEYRNELLNKRGADTAYVIQIVE